MHNRSELREIASIYKAKIIDLSPDSMVFELIGKPDKIDAFLKMFTDYKILEQCRTGVTALERGGMHQHMQKPPQEVREAQLPLPGTHCPARDASDFISAPPVSEKYTMFINQPY